MTNKISKTNVTLTSRLSEVRISEHERIRAEAQMARAEAFADFLAATATAIGRLFKSAPAASSQRTATSAG